MSDETKLHNGDRVQWTLKDGSTGTGMVILQLHAVDGKFSHLSEAGLHALVAVDPLPPDAKSGQAAKEFHPVIFCTKTWLKKIEIEPSPTT